MSSVPVAPTDALYPLLGYPVVAAGPGVDVTGTLNAVDEDDSGHQVLRVGVTTFVKTADVTVVAIDGVPLGEVRARAEAQLAKEETMALLERWRGCCG